MKLTELIERGYLKKALDILEEQSKGHDADISKDIVLLKYRLARYLQKKIRRSEAENTLDIELNQLSESIYDLTLEFQDKYWDIEVLGLDEDSLNKEIKEPKFDDNKEKEGSNDRKIRVNKTLLYLNRVSLVAVLIGFSYMVWLFVQLPPLSEFHFFNTNTKPKSENIISVPIQHLPQVGYDKSLKKAKVFIDVLDDRFTWKLRETVTGVLTYNGKIVDLEQYFSNQNYIEKINQAVDIVCLGNASFEEEENVSVEYRTKFEETRALIRANYLKGLIKSFLKFNNYSTQIYTLNLGKCIDIVKVSNYQRTIVIIRIIEKDEGVILEEALLDALLKEPKMPFKVERYSLVQDKKLDLEIK